MDKVAIVSPVASVRFPNLETTEVIGGVDTEKYSITLIFKPEDKKVLEDAIKSVGGGKGKSPLKEKEGDDGEDIEPLFFTGLDIVVQYIIISTVLCIVCCAFFWCFRMQRNLEQTPQSNIGQIGVRLFLAAGPFGTPTGV